MVPFDHLGQRFSGLSRKGGGAGGGDHMDRLHAILFAGKIINRTSFRMAVCWNEVYRFKPNMLVLGRFLRGNLYNFYVNDACLFVYHWKN